MCAAVRRREGVGAHRHTDTRYVFLTVCRCDISDSIGDFLIAAAIVTTARRPPPPAHPSPSPTHTVAVGEGDLVDRTIDQVGQYIARVHDQRLVEEREETFRSRLRLRCYVF